MNEMSSVSLIIPAYNEEKYISECLKYALLEANGSFLEVIVIDNASTDETSNIARTFEGVRVVREDEKGLTKARQRGFLEAKGDILAYIDADTRMPSGWFAKVQKTFQENRAVGAVSGPYIYHDIPKFQQWIVKYFWWYTLAIPIYKLIGYMIIGGNFAIRRDVLSKMGGFDTSIEFYGEDTDIARRASKFCKVKFMPKLIMYTSGRRFHGQGIVKTGVLYALNMVSQVVAGKPFNQTYTDIR
ncbi:MAG: glycosyl transferase family 2 [Candidatus Vogelbacteria bacterium CG10_big_fil_rev_8_21_14_0_10_45_14]|uniref:Glycosyl transferase family 2 n=1 Tax=Candidatus Vogelbacteria bacterium CG10_big_fil_rev_8_21_14_0_10_45_14 TaxID=1975042 RepID=A0A2H0RK70_9BACT|nr:MAG: glycosyl transferase family 2 [Candidatus Vogelbacteria bacterium CG10_big_fil_rev_8_21_14_0_10_45_14]